MTRDAQDRRSEYREAIALTEAAMEAGDDMLVTRLALHFGFPMPDPRGAREDGGMLVEWLRGELSPKSATEGEAP